MKSQKVVKYRIITCEACGKYIAVDEIELGNNLGAKIEIDVECAHCNHLTPVTQFDLVEAEQKVEIIK